MLEIIGVGFGRTGTHSLKIALETLGFGPCHHMFELKKSKQQLLLWQQVAVSQDTDWKAIFSEYRSQVDWPGAYYWKELIQTFPKAKVILTYRDPVSWYNSFSETIIKANMLGPTLDPDPHTRAMAELVDKIVFKKTFNDHQCDRNLAISKYLSHMSQVLQSVPKDNLLLFNITDGWLPLCNFLNKPVPKANFPESNSMQEFLDRKPFLKNL